MPASLAIERERAIRTSGGHVEVAQMGPIAARLAVYADRAQADRITAANRDQLPPGGRVRIGRRLRIPLGNRRWRSLRIPTVHRFRRSEYQAVDETGLFDGQRVELLEGEIVHMAAKLAPHSFTVHRLTLLLTSRLAAHFVVRFQDPITLDDWSEPEPDVAVCRQTPDGYASAHPDASQVVLLIEVAETSLPYDLGRKVPAYAAAGIGETWVVNLVARQVHVFTDPDRAARRYRRERIAAAGDDLELPDGSRIAVSDFLPPAAST